MRFFYDTEFLEDGKTIALISIAIVAEDGSEYYAVNSQAPWGRIKKHPWLMENVVPHLPHGHGDWRNHMPRNWAVDFADSRVKPKKQIAEEVALFLRGPVEPWWPIELWAWYAAYDHVALAQLWGRMIDLPEGIPMWTNDLRQEVARLGDPDLPAQKGGEHDALADARHVKAMFHALFGGTP
jgi:hypothetical protein